MRFGSRAIGPDANCFQGKTVSFTPNMKKPPEGGFTKYLIQSDLIIN